MEYIYVLSLSEGKYYVGKTKNLSTRLEFHMKGLGSAWTIKYKPISVVEEFLCKSIFDEDKTTKEYMAKYGIDNVRGGAYTQIVLPEFDKILLQKEINHAHNKCVRCGKFGHFVMQCDEKVRTEPVIMKSETDTEQIYDKSNNYAIETLARILKELDGSEKIFVRVFCNGSNNHCYNVCYITDHGNIYYGSPDKPIVVKIGFNNNELLSYEKMFVLKKHHFMATHYSKVKSEVMKMMVKF